MEDMEITDNLLPLDGESFYPRIDPELQEELNNEKTKVLAAAPLIEDILMWFDNQIEHLNTLNAIDFNSKVSIEAQVYGRKYAVDRLMEVRSELEVLQEEYTTPAKR
jgi:hypothetical protein